MLKLGKIYLRPSWAWRYIEKNPSLFGDFPLMIVDHPKKGDKIAYQLVYK
jgi:hypothetical protein